MCLCSLNMDFKMALHAICFILLCSRVFANEQKYKNDGFMNKLSSGMKFAQNLLGSESVALKVAEFVVKAFQTANRPVNRRRPPQEGFTDAHEPLSDDKPDDVEDIPSPMAPLRHLVRLFGLQSNQISAVAVNALVFVAQMISTFLTGPRRPGRINDTEDPKLWILNKNSRHLQDLITAAQNETLPDSIEELIREQGTEEETSCIRLFVCKITPFVNRMQKAVFGQDDYTTERVKGSKNMYRHLPSAEEINDRSDICEQRHRNCNLNE